MAYDENIKSILKRLNETGGVIEPWMINCVTAGDLRKLWQSGEWIDLNIYWRE